MTHYTKYFMLLIKSIFYISVALVVCLGVIGGGWGPKQVPESHPFYSEEKMLIAHRGVTDQAPENTFASAQRAIELGFSAIEIDIKQSADEQFYLFHDRLSTRLFKEDFPLKEKTLDQLQKLPLYHKGIPTDHGVPGLESFTRKFASDLIFYVDVKRHGNNRYNYLTDKIAEFLQRHQLTDNAFVGSDFLFTAYLEYRHPELHTVFTGPGDALIMVYDWIPRKFRPDFIISYAQGVTEKHLDWLHRKGLMNRRMLYGVNGDNYLEVRQWGIPKLLVDYDPVMNKDLIN